MKKYILFPVLIVALFGAFALLAEEEQVSMKPCGMMDQGPKMQEMDARLETLIAEVKKNTGDKKVEAMTAVVEELLAQRKAMHAQMGEKHQHMAMAGCGEGKTNCCTGKGCCAK